MRPLKPLERRMLADIDDGAWHDVLAWPMDVTEQSWWRMIRTAWATRFLKINRLIEYHETGSAGDRRIWVRITLRGKAELKKGNNDV